MNTPLSPEDLKAVFNEMNGRDIKVHSYDNIIESDNIHNLFGSDKAIVIFYPALEHNGMKMGHYTCLIRNPNRKTFYYYDSLAYKIDEYKKFADRAKLYRERLNSLVKHMYLQAQDGWTIDYNNHQHQSRKPTVATCGRWCVLRCTEGTVDMSNEEFHKFLNKAWKQFFPNSGRTKLRDKLVLKLTSAEE